MIRMSAIDPNFKAPEGMPEGMCFYDPCHPPFETYGLAENKPGVFCRLPETMLPACREGIQHLAYHLAGACIRFSTDADQIGLICTLRDTEILIKFASSGQSGMELFEETNEGTRQINCTLPLYDQGCGLIREQRFCFPLPGGMRHYVLYLPLYNGLEKLAIGFPEGAQVLPGRKPAVEKPIVYYGSSITQGGYASKPGSCYTTILARRLDAAQINLVFSGNCKGDLEIARYIAGLEMSVFVMDYDHNAVPAEALLDTHEPFFSVIREAQPELPIVMITRPDTDKDLTDSAKRLEYIRRTYDHAVAAGDQNVYFVDGGTLFGDTDRDLCTIDKVHPTDIGFLRMADGLEPLLRSILKKAR